MNPRAPNIFGLPIRYGTLKQAGHPPNFFDVITFWAVLEHTPDIVEQISEAYRILKPEGTLVLLTTNYYSINTGILKLDDVPRHLILFTGKTLKLLLVNHGLTVERIQCSDAIFKASAYGILQYLAARFIFRDTEHFYREFFKTQYQPKRDFRSRIERIRSMGWAKALLVAADRLTGMVLDRISLLLNLYGIIIVRARK